MATLTSERATALEVMHTSERRWNTLRAEGIEWRDDGPALVAFRRSLPARSRELVGPEDAPREPLGESTEEWRLWIRSPNTYRAEFLVGDERVEAVIDGLWWWSWSPSRGAQTNDGRANHGHGLGPGEPLFRPALLLPAIDLDVTGSAERAGRTTMELLGRPVGPRERTAFDDEDNHFSLEVHGIGSGADDYLLSVDSTTGVLLRSEARLEGRPFRVIEVTMIALDETFDEETFVIRPPDGRDFESVGLE